MLGANRWLVADCIIYTSIMELNRVFFGNSKLEDSKLKSMKIYPRCPRGITLLSAVITSVLHHDWSNHWGNSYVGTYRTLITRCCHQHRCLQNLSILSLSQVAPVIPFLHVHSHVASNGLVGVYPKPPCVDPIAATTVHAECPWSGLHRVFLIERNFEEKF